MDRLTANLLPLDTFNRCQLCGFASYDICVFRMWTECDDADQPEPGNILIACKKGACAQRIHDHARLYIEVPWGRGDPGHMMLLCGDCPSRNGSNCTHPKRKTNGGPGLAARVYPSTVDVWLTTTDGCRHVQAPQPVVACEGHPTKSK